MIFNVEGVIAPVFTPFNESGDIEIPKITPYMEFLNKHQVNGILVGGTTGETMTLSVKERKTLLEAWLTAARPYGTRVIAQIGGAAFPDVIELHIGPSVMMGNESSIATVSNIFPDLVHNIIAAVKNNEVTKAKVLQKTLNKLVDGIVSSVTHHVGGTTGETMTLSVKERKTLLEAWLTAARPYGTRVIAQIGGAAFPDVIELAKHAEMMKADAIMTLPELYYKPKNVEQLVAYLDQVSKAAPSLPLIYYHFPMMTTVDVNMQQLFTAASTKIPNFKGAKADLAVADQVAELLNKDQRIFIANHHIGPSVMMGNESSIATVSNIFPDLVHNIIAAVKNNEVTKAKVLQKTLNKLVDGIVSQGDFVPTMKYAMKIMTNLDMGPMRQPLTALSMDQKNKIKENLQNFEILDETRININ